MLICRQVNKPEAAAQLLDKAAKILEKTRTEEAIGKDKKNIQYRIQSKYLCSLKPVNGFSGISLQFTPALCLRICVVESRYNYIVCDGVGGSCVGGLWSMYLDIVRCFLCTGGEYYVLYMALLISKLF
jgi:hypothetical protein